MTQQPPKKKILVVGFDCAAPELLFGDPQLQAPSRRDRWRQLTNIRRMMAAGIYGRLESVIPPITVPAWMCMATSQDPGSLGIYGFRNRADRSYGGLTTVNSQSITTPAIWDYLGAQGRHVVCIGVPPGFPPRQVNGLWVGCFLTPDTNKCEYTYPPELQDEIRHLVCDYPVDVTGFRTADKKQLLDDIYTMSRKQFAVVRHFLARNDWDYFQFVEIGLDRIHHGFWKHHDPQHVQHVPGSPYANVVRNYYRHLDEELGRILELVSNDTVVLVVSDHGARPLDGGFCVNQWLVNEGWLVLEEAPTEVTPLAKLKVNWKRSRAWSEGGYYARVFLNVAGREPQGAIAPADYEQVRDELKCRLESTVDPSGKPLGTLVFKPEEVYRHVRGLAPDLIVHFGGLAWRSIGGVGYPTVHVQENDTGPDDCNHAQFGAFILTAPNLSPRGYVTGAHLLDMAPTLLALAGYAVPAAMQGEVL